MTANQTKVFIRLSSCRLMNILYTKPTNLSNIVPFCQKIATNFQKKQKFAFFVPLQANMHSFFAVFTTYIVLLIKKNTLFSFVFFYDFKFLIDNKVFLLTPNALFDRLLPCGDKHEKLT